MLPAEAFTDVASFLGYYDLGGLKLANKMLSAVATQCADAIRVFDFPDLAFFVHDSWIEVFRLEQDGTESWVCNLEFGSQRELATFIPEAFRNCTVCLFALMYIRPETPEVHSATKDVANTVVADTLCVASQHADKMQYVDSFRLVKRLRIWWSVHMSLEEKNSLENFCQRKNIAVDF